MNCQNCGGPLAETCSRGRMLCGYCDSVNLVEVDGDTLDRVVVLGHLGNHSCPSCLQELATALIDEHQVEFCTRCQGVLADRDIFTRVVWTRRENYRGINELPPQPHPQELRTKRNCPACANLMETYRFYGPGNAVIDACQACQLIWLDGGELTTIEKAPGQRQLARKIATKEVKTDSPSFSRQPPMHPLLEILFMIIK